MAAKALQSGRLVALCVMRPRLCRMGKLWMVVVMVMVTACGGTGPEPQNPPAPEVDPTPAVQALRAADFEKARTSSTAILKQDPDNATAAAVRALSSYQAAAHHLVTTVGRVFDEIDQGRSGDASFNHELMRAALIDTEAAFARVDDDLKVAADDSRFRLELCLACWERDWNHSGEIDERDRLLLQIEVDAEGESIPEGDPRRKPTFHFDVGDVYWARAMVSFQRASLQLVLAYRWTELDKLIRGEGIFSLPTIVIKLESKDRVIKARDLFVQGLQYSRRSRTEYLAETDDDREWVPNPTQKNHPLPLPMDESIFKTWVGVVDDLENLALGREGLSVEELFQAGDDQWENPPKGFIDIGRMLAQPKNIVMDLKALNAIDREQEPGQMLELLLGDYYIESMKPSPLVKRLSRMKAELSRGEDSFERKLRYLLWIN